MRRLLKDNGLLLVNLALFVIFLGGMTSTGWQTNNEELTEHGQAAIALTSYLASGDYGEAIFENWESEFLAVAAIVFGTIYFRQRGSKQSKPVAAAHTDTGD